MLPTDDLSDVGRIGAVEEAAHTAPSTTEWQSERPKEKGLSKALIDTFYAPRYAMQTHISYRSHASMAGDCINRC